MSQFEDIDIKLASVGISLGGIVSACAMVVAPNAPAYVTLGVMLQLGALVRPTSFVLPFFGGFREGVQRGVLGLGGSFWWYFWRDFWDVASNDCTMRCAMK